MLTKEEYKHLKEKHNRLSEMNVEYDAQIELLKAQNQQIPHLSKQLEEIKKDRERMEEMFSVEINEANMQIVNFRKSNPSIRGIVSSKIPEPKAQDPNIMKLEQQLTKTQETLDNLESSEMSLCEEIAFYAASEQQITSEIEDMNHLQDRFSHIIPKIESIKGTGFYFQDLIVQIENLKASRSIQQGRRNKLNGWQSQALVINESQKNTLSGITFDHEKVLSLSHQEESKSILLQSQFAGLNNDFSQLLIKVSDLELQLENEQNQTQDDIKSIKLTIESNKILFDENAKQIAGLKNQIDNYQASEKKLLQKRLDMIQQLEKRVEQEKKSKPKEDINNPFIIELTATAEELMNELESEKNELKYQEKLLQKNQDELQKKEYIIEEFKTLHSYRNPVPEEEAFHEFLNLCKEIEIKHYSFVDDLANISETLQCVEEENICLSQTYQNLL